MPFIKRVNSINYRKYINKMKTVLRWIASPIAALAGLLIARGLIIVSRYFYATSLWGDRADFFTYIPKELTLANIIAFCFGCIIEGYFFVFLASYVSPNQKIASIIFGTIAITFCIIGAISALIIKDNGWGWTMLAAIMTIIGASASAKQMYSEDE